MKTQTTYDNTITSTKSKSGTALSITKKAVVGALITTMFCTSAMAGTYSEHMSPLDKIKQEQHEQAERNEEIGLGTGFVVGAIVGGPIGAFVATIAGHFIAKHVNANDNIDALEVALIEEKNSYEHTLTAAQKRYDAKLQASEQAYQAELLALEQNYQISQSAGQVNAESLLMSLQFSTGSAEIAPHYQEQVALLADVLNKTPTMTIDLTGYTDLLGEEQVNQALSVARVESVKSLLMAQGVEENRIMTEGLGESHPIAANAQNESNFYDRRVVLKLQNPLSQTAKNQ